MKFGVRDIADVTFRAKQTTKIGASTFVKGQPVLYIDSAKTATLEGAGTSVYATGGRGNSRLVTWEGEKTLTFTVEDALLSQAGFAILSGAGLFEGSSDEDLVHVHMTARAVTEDNKIDLAEAVEKAGKGAEIDSTAPIFVMKTDETGDLTGELVKVEMKADGNALVPAAEDGSISEGQTVLVDFYVTKPSTGVSELQIDAENFAGSYYVEASTLFRDVNGIDYPANLTLPNVKIQSNFTFSMAATGDPSTFTFTMDASPGYTYFNKKKKVLCAIQVLKDTDKTSGSVESVFPHGTETMRDLLDWKDNESI